MTQHEFDRLSEKYLAGNCTEEEIAMLKKWAEFHYEDQIEAECNPETGSRIWNTIESDLGHQPRNFWFIAGGIAATLVLAGFFIFFSGIKVSEPIQISAEKTIPEIAAADPSKVTLPDGSYVLLEKGADITTARGFGVENRKVWLKGEAFFEVKPNPDLPFTVHMDDLVTEVLGTSFRIKPRIDQKKIEVSVLSGKVSVYTTQVGSNKRKDGVIAMPNQRISYDITLKTLKQDLVETPVPLTRENVAADFSFDETPVEEVFAKMSEVYGVQVLIATPDIKRCTFTGDLGGLDLFRQLDFVSEVVGLAYEMRGTAVFVTGKGCRAQ